MKLNRKLEDSLELKITSCYLVLICTIPRLVVSGHTHIGQESRHRILLLCRADNTKCLERREKKGKICG